MPYKSPVMNLKKALFIDRDGTLIAEPADEQIDSFEKLRFVPGMLTQLSLIRQKTDFEFVMVSNQDGLGTPSFPENTFWPVHNFLLDTLRSVGVEFDNILIDTTFPEAGANTRKPGTGMLGKYTTGRYDLANSYVIGDRDTDARLAANLGCRHLLLSPDMDWHRIASVLIGGARRAEVRRQTAETDIRVSLDLDGTGQADIHTGLGFLDHMLQQIARHAGIDVTVSARGDLHVDEHHTVEDTAIVLGTALREALGTKQGLQRYGFVLPMDDSLARVAVDLGGRPWLVWRATFRRERVGDVPTELFPHFFRSLADAAAINLNISATGDNEHHKIEAIFKAFARALRMALRRDPADLTLPSSKGRL